ncbi:hypothetical protein PG990_003204 [Apiospora arundinis]
MEALRRCATKGYLSAQAIYAQVSRRVRYADRDDRPVPPEWTIAAVRSGYLFPFTEENHVDPSILHQAWADFRKAGGYNVHCCSQSARYPSNEPRISTGLMGDLEGDLEDYDLQLSVALNELGPGGSTCLLDL